MKTSLIVLLALLAFQLSDGGRLAKKKRGSFDSYSLSPDQFALGETLSYDLSESQSQNGWRGSNVPIQTSGVDHYLPIPQINTADYSLKVNLPAPHLPIVSNSIDKPVMEQQEIVPPQSIGTAIIPLMPPPATPVNAAASNVPANQGAVFLGSGGLGVVNLGNGAYALGSGSIGYSGNRAQPRPTALVPIYPPLPASPNLLPAAVPSGAPPLSSIPQPAQPAPMINYDDPALNIPVPIIDQNGYEYLAPNRIGFGAPNPRIRPPKVRQQFATPTTLQLQPQVPQIPANFDFTFSHSGNRFSNLG